MAQVGLRVNTLAPSRLWLSAGTALNSKMARWCFLVLSASRIHIEKFSRAHLPSGNSGILAFCKSVQQASYRARMRLSLNFSSAASADTRSCLALSSSIHGVHGHGHPFSTASDEYPQRSGDTKTSLVTMFPAPNLRAFRFSDSCQCDLRAASREKVHICDVTQSR